MAFDMEDSSKGSAIKGVTNGFLADIIDFYQYREIEVKNGSILHKLMPCKHTNSIDFFIGDEYETIDLQTGEKQSFIRCTIRGPRTYKKYAINIQGNFKSFSIKFKPTGIFQLLRVPMNNFCNTATDGLSVQPIVFKEITKLLMECNDLDACIKIVEPFLIKMLAQNKNKPSPVSILSQLIIDKAQTVPLSILYKQLPLTPRQLERNFTKEIGLPPKQYSALVRFEKLIKHKIEKPQCKWTDLTYEYNYFDQMHMIRDFHKFLDINPKSFQAADFAF